jgi:hypothetical protein
MGETMEVIFEVLTAVKMPMFFWVVTLYSLTGNLGLPYFWNEKTGHYRFFSVKNGT